MILWILGSYLNRPTEQRELVDPNTGERFVVSGGGGHSLLFIPMQYWAPIAILIGIIVALGK